MSYWHAYLLLLPIGLVPCTILFALAARAHLRDRRR